MAESTTPIFFITGATRGLGLSLVSDVASKYPSAIIYAGVRDPSSPGASALKEIAEKYPRRVEIVKYVAADEAGNKATAREIGQKHGRVDVVIANAAMCGGFAPVHEVDIAQYREHVSVNVIGPIVLFQAFYHLLRASTNPKFVPITSVGGSIVISTPWTIHFENEWLVCFPLSPGNVETDMLSYAVTHDITRCIADYVDQEGSRSPEAAACAIIDIIAAATRETEGGQYVNVDGSRLPW